MFELKNIINVFRNNKLKFLLLFVLILFVIWIFTPINALDKDYSTVVVDKDNKILRVFLNKDEQWYLPPEKNLEIPDKLKTSILYFEDKYFYYHLGINPISIFNSFIENLQKGYISRGGSTITMQVSRIINPQRRTYINKIKEIFNSIKLELKYSKNDILNMYINNAPYGGNIIGYRAASLYYYQKSPQELTWSEACTLAVLPNSPGIISPINNNQLLINKKNRLLRLLSDNNIINKEILDISLKEPVPNIINRTPFLAPHLSQMLKDKYPEQKIINTNISFQYQSDIEKIVKNYSKHLQNKGIKNISVVVSDTQSGKVETFIGSQDFFDIENKGEVNGVIAPRSTGSILKPFLYALAIDDGLVLPDTLIKDIPTYFGAFSPENADKKYNGLISMKESLIRSLNVPAVLTLNEYGVYDFYNFLKKSELTTLFRKSDEYGLTLILGGAEANLLEITSLYSSLGRLGKFTKLKLIPSEQVQEEKQLISKGSSNIILNVLKDLKRPDAEYYWQQYENQFKLAWKTGTSFGNRDAWAIGVNNKWTVGVWVGNFNGESNSNLAGATSAGSLMFDIFNYLPQKSRLNWFKKDFNDLEMIEICQDTGYKAGFNCDKKVLVDKPVNSKTLKICPYHKAIFVTNDNKNQVCSLCWEKDNYRKKNILLYTPDIIDYLRKRGNIISEIPPHKTNCPSIQSKNFVQIIYPINNAKIFLPRDIGGVTQKLNMKVSHLNENNKVYWYLDDKFLGVTQANHSRAIELKKGSHNLSVVDENGNKDSCYFLVEKK
jgi:penicillin-binding protein 1C